jgi:hypothetical protein
MWNGNMEHLPIKDKTERKQISWYHPDNPWDGIRD